MVVKVSASLQSNAELRARSTFDLTRESRQIAWRSYSTDPRGLRAPRHIDLPVHAQKQKPSTIDELIERTHLRQLKARRDVFSRELPFSWPRFFIGFISLALVFSDIPRSGLGIQSLDHLYPRIETDTSNFFGSPWNYTVFESTKEDAASLTARVWSYKFDSTSIVWQAFAKYLGVQAYPSCLLYREKCPAKRFSGATALAMIDALVDRIADHSINRWRAKSNRPAVTLRSDNIYRDRIHNFLLPGLFPNRLWRTHQAFYFSAEALAGLNPKEICHPTIRAPIPNFCQEHWINFRRSCPATDIACQDVGLIHVHAVSRVREIEARFSDLSVDFVILESQEDYQVGVGSISKLAVRRSDISTIIRAQKCSNGACETMYVNDYRYEVGMLLSDAPHWYKLIVVLRLLGQTYFIARALMLMASCYFALGNNPDATSESESLQDRLNKARRLFMKVPTQCVVFGSPLPIIVYTAAHAIDASVMYAVLENRFISQNGVLDLSLTDFISVAVIQMRSTWLFALLWHAIVKLTTWGRWTGWSHLSGGIIGVPEFLISGIAGITIISQFRSTSFRSSEIVSVFEVLSATGLSKKDVMRQLTFTNLGWGTRQLGGVVIDLKFLTCIVGVIGTCLLLRSMVLLIRTLRGKRLLAAHWPLGTSPVPYSAGILWPAVSLCVHWTSDFYCIHESSQQSIIQRLGRRATRVLPSSLSYSQIMGSSRSGSRKRIISSSTRKLSIALSMDAARMSLQTFSFIQFQMERLDTRGDAVEANVAFMNLVLLSDPVVFFYARVAGGGQTLAYFRSHADPDRVLLLPTAAVGPANEYTKRLKKLREVNAAELAWAALVQCG